METEMAQSSIESEIIQSSNQSTSIRLRRAPPISERIVDFDFPFIANEECDDELNGITDPQLKAQQITIKSEEYRQLFQLPHDEVLIEDFNCALQKNILLQGHMYIFEHYLCFYSNIFGYEKKKVIILKDVTSVRKAKTAGLFPNAIEITAWGKKSFFGSFVSRDEAYRLIVEGWCRNSQNAIVDSVSQSNHPSDSGQVQQESQESSSSENGNIEGPCNMNSKSGDTNCTETTNNLQSDALSSCSQGTGTISDSDSNETIFWEVEGAHAPQVPNEYKEIMECELPVDIRDFFQLFFSNAALKFSETFHKKCGDQDYQCKEWARDTELGYVRDVSFRHPVKAPIGPKSTMCQVVQRYRVYKNSHLIIESSQQMTDIPYGSYFRVEIRWDVTPTTKGSTPHCAVRVFLGVTFTKKVSLWKGKIEQGAYDESKNIYASWKTEALKYAEERSLNKGSKDRGLTCLPKKSSLPPSGVSGSENLAKSKEDEPKDETKMIVGDTISKIVPVKSSYYKAKRGLFPNGDGLLYMSQNKLLAIFCTMALIILIQTIIIIVLRGSKVEPLDVRYSRDVPLDSDWLKQSLQLLKEEIAITEARVENMHNNIDVLKAAMVKLASYSTS